MRSLFCRVVLEREQYDGASSISVQWRPHTKEPHNSEETRLVLARNYAYGSLKQLASSIEQKEAGSLRKANTSNAGNPLSMRCCFQVAQQRI